MDTAMPAAIASCSSHAPTVCGSTRASWVLARRSTVSAPVKTWPMPLPQRHDVCVPMLATGSHDALQTPTCLLAEGQSEVVLDHTTLLQRLSGDLELLQELRDLFLTVYPQHLARLRKAILLRESTAFVQEIITLKGMLGNLGAIEACGIVQQLKTLGCEADLGRLLTAHEALQNALARFATALWTFSQTATSHLGEF